MDGTISWISIAPVKGMRVQSLDEVELTSEGIPGDRAFILVDAKGAMVNGKRFGALMEIVPLHDRVNGTLSLGFPDGGVVDEMVELGEPEPVTFYGQPEMARPVAGPFSQAISDHAGADLRLMASPDGRAGVDRGKWGGVTFLGAASLDRLREAGRQFNCDEGKEDDDPGPIDQRRFRMNLGVEDIEAYAEDGWVGSEVLVGDVRVRVGGHVGRCAVTTRDPDSGQTDLKTLHFLKFSRDDVDSHEALPFGVYGEILESGTVRIGDQISLVG